MRANARELKSSGLATCINSLGRFEGLKAWKLRVRDEA